MMPRARTFVVALALLTLPGAARAQDVQLSLGTGWYRPGGEDFDDTDPGVGFDAAVRFGVSSRVQVGVGGQWNVHGVDFSSDNYDVVGAFVEPRVSLPGSGSASVVPFVSGRVAWARQSIRVGTADRAASGFAVGVGAGLAFPLRSGVELEAGLTGYLLDFGDFKVDGVERSGSGSSGHALGLRIALNLAR